MVRRGILILFLVSLNACTNSAAHIRPNEEVTSSISADQVRTAQERPEPISIADTLGVVVLGNNYSKSDFIRLYNQDGSVWYQFKFFYDDSDNDFEDANENFRPFAFHPDYFLLTLTCVGKDRDRYEVVVNEETRLTKYVDLDDATLRFETWEEHVLNDVVNIGFNQVENSLRLTPDGRLIDPKLFSPQSFVSPLEVNGDWLKVKWSNTLQKDNSEPLYIAGWIRWKKNGRLLIELQYLC